MKKEVAGWKKEATDLRREVEHLNKEEADWKKESTELRKEVAHLKNLVDQLMLPSYSAGESSTS